MIDYLNYIPIGFAVVLGVELAIWVQACLGLSMRHEDVDFTKMIAGAPYRVLWPPKVSVAIVEIVLITVATKYYRSGGNELTIAIATFFGLVCLGTLVVCESIRAIRKYVDGRS